MLFGKLLQQLRLSKALTQEQAAKMIGVSPRTLQNYESGAKYPKKNEVYQKIAEVFGIDPASLISDEDHQVVFAIEKGGAKSGRDVQALVAEVGGLFAGGDLSDDDKDKVLRVITDLYWRAKEKNKKYTPKKYLAESDEPESPG